MYEVISIGSSLVDIFVHSDQFGIEALSGKNRFILEGDKVDIESFVVRVGGGAANTAVGFSRLGFKASVISETGNDDFADVIFHNLHRENVDTSLIVKEKQERTGGSILLVSGNGRRTAMVHRGAASQLDPYDISPFRLSQARWVHLSSIAGRLETLKRIFDLVRMHADTTLSWNPGKQELSLIAEGKLAVKDIPCLILFMNAQEWEMVKEQQEELIHEIPQIVVTNGGEGGWVYIHGKKELRFLGAQVKSVDDTGAGDAFATGYAAGQILQLHPRISVEWGVRNATSVIRYFGAQPGLLGREHIEGKVPSSL